MDCKLIVDVAQQLERENQDAVEKDLDEICIVVESNTVSYPGAMMVHSEYANIALAAVMRPGRLIVLTFGAVYC